MLSRDLTRDEIVDLLTYLKTDKIKNRVSKNDIQFCCAHGESNPSAGINVERIEDKVSIQTVNCFSCHFHGGLPYYMNNFYPDEFPTVQDAEDFIADRYKIDNYGIDVTITRGLRRIGEDYDLADDDEEEEKEKPRFELPIYEIAPYKSGKATYQYFFDRGFTKDTMRKFKIGFDSAAKTITVPLFWEDEVLAGIIGRYISKNRKHNERYKIYNCPTGEIMYPLHDLEIPESGEVYLVEGLLDGLWCHQCGIKNSLALLTNYLSKGQIELLKRLGVKKLIDATDADNMGDIATKSIQKACGREGWDYLTIKDCYPDYIKDDEEDRKCKDPQDCTEEQLLELFSQKHSKLRRKLRRI